MSEELKSDINESLSIAGLGIAASPKELFDTALAQYVNKLMEVSAVLADRQQRALSSYLETAGGALPANPGEASAAEYQDLVSAIQSQDAGKIASSQAAYLESLRKLQTGIADDTRASLDAYVAEIRDSWEQAGSESQASYQQYVGEISAALSQISAADLDPVALATIGQALSTVAVYASTVRQSLPGAGWGAWS